MKRRARKVKHQAILQEYFESFIAAILIALILRAFVLAAYKIPSSSMVPTLKPGDFIFAFKLPYGIQIPFTHIKFFGPHEPGRGQVVIFRFPDDESILCVKRVIGVPGDKIYVHGRKVFLNDRLLTLTPARTVPALTADLPMSDLYDTYQESLAPGERHWVTYRRDQVEDDFGPVVVPPGRIFLMGDNRDASDDSRYWGHGGMVPAGNVEGLALMIWASLDWEHSTLNTAATASGAFSSWPRFRWSRFFSLIH